MRIFRLLIVLSACSLLSCNQKQTAVEKSQTNEISDRKTTLPDREKVSVFCTAKGAKEKMAKLEEIKLSAFPQPDESLPTIMIDETKTFQTIEGFGGALTDASAETFYKLSKVKQQQILDAYFDQEKGIGYTLCRTNMNSCDFSSDMYTYVNEGDTALSSFNLDHDKKFKIPFIKEALKTAGKDFKLYASPWSPPAWMKSNNDMLHGGKLKPEYFGPWARYFSRFIKEFEKEGVPMWGLTVQNEPMATQTWESCIYTGEEERDFVKNHLGPELMKSGLSKLKLIIWDHNRGIMYQRAKVVFDDPEAAKYVWGTGFHWYVGDHFENVRLVHDAFPDKNLIFTEGCFGPFDMKKINDWNWGEGYARSMINDLNNWAVAIVDWNVILDEQGGPNHVKNFCYAPIIGNTKTGELIYMNSYYYIGHITKFIKQGAKRIICSSNDDNLLATAFINPDGKIAVVILNQQDKEVEMTLWIEGKAAKTKSPAHSIITLIL